MSPEITVSATTKSAAVQVSGEVDVSNASSLRDAINEALAALGSGSELLVNIGDVSYIDSTGIGVLVGAARHAAEKGVSFSVVNPQRNVARVLGLLRVEEELHVVNGSVEVPQELAAEFAAAEEEAQQE